MRSFHFNHSGLLCWVAHGFQLYELHCKLQKDIARTPFLRKHYLVIIVIVVVVVTVNCYFELSFLFWLLRIWLLLLLSGRLSINYQARLQKTIAVLIYCGFVNQFLVSDEILSCIFGAFFGRRSRLSEQLLMCIVRLTSRIAGCLLPH